MGLDVYVGSLTRYYVGDWETVIQRMGREQGIQVQIRRPMTPPRSLVTRIVERLIRSRRSGTVAAMRAVERWRRQLGRASNFGASFQWNENFEYEYFTDKPAWDCYGALVLWACYEQLPAAHRAKTALEWNEDPAYRTGLMLPVQRYSHLVADTEIWFPVEFEQPFGVTSITGEPMLVGSSVQLLRELEQLNARSWRADDDAVARWRGEGAAYGTEFETSAQLGFSVFYELAKLSVQHKLPMKLDY